MDRVEQYREILARVIAGYAAHKPANGDIDSEVVIDPVRDHYEVVHHGWGGRRRVHGCVLHADIIDGKIWVQYDGTDHPLAEELVLEGVPREDIVLAFHPPEMRRYTGYGVGTA
jgi:hypothetical protein